MNKKIETSIENEFSEEDKYRKFCGLRDQVLVIEGIENENKIRSIIRGEKDYEDVEQEYVDEYDDALTSIIEKSGEESEKTKEVRKICSLFDVSLDVNLLETEDDKGFMFWEAIEVIIRYKEREKSLLYAIEQQKKEGIKFEGFENDTHFKNANEFLKKSFPNGLLDKALISRISYFPETVSIVRNGNYYLPVEKYLQWKKEVEKYGDNLSKNKVRAANISSGNKRGLFNSTPIEVYSFIDENLENFEYLNDLPEEEKMHMYKLGTLSHEVGHNLYINIFNKELKKEWSSIVNETGHLTHYSKKYANGTHGNELNKEEEFAEAVRIITINPDYLKQKFSKVYDFLNKAFPEMTD